MSFVRENGLLVSITWEGAHHGAIFCFFELRGCSSHVGGPLLGYAGWSLGVFYRFESTVEASMGRVKPLKTIRSKGIQSLQDITRTYDTLQ